LLGPAVVLAAFAVAAASAGARAVRARDVPDGTSVYVANSGDDTVSEYDVAADGELSLKSPATVRTAIGRDRRYLGE
jgi:hypothetical protein